MYKGIGSEANRTESGSPFVLQPKCPVTLKGIGVKATPECGSGSPFVLQPKCPVTLKGIGTDRRRPGRSGVGGSRSDATARVSTGTRRPQGPSRRGVAPRVLRISFDGSRHIKPVEVEPLRHAISCRSGRVSPPLGGEGVPNRQPGAAGRYLARCPPCVCARSPGRTVEDMLDI
jgi:hypothetical protein